MDQEKYKVITKKIIVSGIVQGVGFRPLTFRIAQKHNIMGTVQNIGGMVEIITQSAQKSFDEFLHDLKTAQCEGCEIINIEITDFNTLETYTEFKIIESISKDEISIIPPDLATCESCRQELYTQTDRRFVNPFISCMSCGPRYTIIEKLPYDRDHTTMEDFVMCPSCRAEYTSPISRRFHAQTISCNDCGPYLIFQELNKNDHKEPAYKSRLSHKQAFDKAVDIIKSGGIIAVKGIGGYHFACSPFVEETVENLRKLKGREEKPFAVMFESVESIKNYCEVSKEEQLLLESKPRPIVLLYANNERMAPSTYKDSIYCGAFLPYTPLQMMLLEQCGPLIMTSANRSNKPIIREDDEILSVKSPFLQGVLYNTRRIIRSVDDSVAKVLDHKAQLIRRSRGYVPYPVFLPQRKNNIQIFAAGGDLKAAYCLYNNGSAVVSQYFGDLEEQSVLDEYTTSVTDLSALLKIKSELAVCDLHPNYFSAEYARKLGIPVLPVQHHHAHIASVMAEHNLKEKVIGIAFDGTGYGTDGAIWGSEFMVCENADYIRAAHLKYTPIIGGDQSMRDAKKTATCFLLNAGLNEYINDNRSDIMKAALKNHINTVLSSSMGRLFDVIASILGIKDENHFEGECAANLEKEAVLAQRNNVVPEQLEFALFQKDEMIEIDSFPVLEAICRLRGTEHTASLALGFHYAVADVVLKVCRIIRLQQNSDVVAISGGVFQNTVLSERVLKVLRADGFHVYYNIAVPPNDGSISLGQTYIGLMNQQEYNK